jgi:hypothetical protein
VQSAPTILIHALLNKRKGEWRNKKGEKKTRKGGSTPAPLIVHPKYATSYIGPNVVIIRDEHTKESRVRNIMLFHKYRKMDEMFKS